MTSSVVFGDSLENTTGQPVVSYIPMLNSLLGVTFNGISAARQFGGTMNSFLQITEIMG